MKHYYIYDMRLWRLPTSIAPKIVIKTKAREEGSGINTASRRTLSKWPDEKDEPA